MSYYHKHQNNSKSKFQKPWKYQKKLANIDNISYLDKVINPK